MTDAPVIRTAGLTKLFGGTAVVDHLNLEIRRGEIYGLVGPDGSGKTTVMRLLTAILAPTSGEAWVAGHSILNEGESIKARIGYMSQRFGLYEELSVMENILFYADLYEAPAKERPQRIQRLLSFSNLTPFKERLAGRLSGGMKQKLGLACALIHTPGILFLDEPTNGVDPVSRRDFWKILYDLLKQGITILISTSYLDEAERCTRIGLMYQGRILIEDDPSIVRRSMGIPMVEIRPEDARRAMEIAGTLPGVQRVSIYGDRLHITLESREVLGRVLEEMKQNQIGIKGSREIVPSLEDIFISMVESQ